MTFLYWTGHRVLEFLRVHEPPFMTSGKGRHGENDEFMLIWMGPMFSVVTVQDQESFPMERLLPALPRSHKGVMWGAHCAAQSPAAAVKHLRSLL